MLPSILLSRVIATNAIHNPSISVLMLLLADGKSRKNIPYLLRPIPPSYGLVKAASILLDFDCHFQKFLAN
jgi:hypothetical protein